MMLIGPGLTLQVRDDGEVLEPYTLPKLRDAVRSWATALSGEDEHHTLTRYASSSLRAS